MQILILSVTSTKGSGAPVGTMYSEWLVHFTAHLQRKGHGNRCLLVDKQRD